MNFPEFKPAKDPHDLRNRVKGLLSSNFSHRPKSRQLSLPLDTHITFKGENGPYQRAIIDFLDFISCSIPNGDLYLFGGVLRDLALYGKRGFDSDLDLIVDGNWSHLLPLLKENHCAKQNKFGGFRFEYKGWLIDIWNAKDTWAFKQGHIEFHGVGSLIHTTITNWDAILMNWRSKEFIHSNSYFNDLNGRVLDVVLTQSPNPLGTAVRVFRHLHLKDARKITQSAAQFLHECSLRYEHKEFYEAELKSYQNSVISKPLLNFFKDVGPIQKGELASRFSTTSEIFEQELALHH